MKESFIKTYRMYMGAMPIMIGILLLINLLNPILQNYYKEVFTGQYLLDSLIGSIVGSISFGIPITSYIVGGELMKEGVSLLAVTAFILTWSTVGIAMLPLEASYLGKGFAFFRNLFNFLFSIIIAILTVLITIYIKSWL